MSTSASDRSGPGSGSTRAARRLAAVLAEQRDDLLRSVAEVRLHRAGSVHRTRIAVRRLRSTLATFRRHLDGPVTDPIRTELAWLGTELGAARDAEVIEHQLLAAIGRAGPVDVPDPARAALVTAAAADVRLGSARATAALEGVRYAALAEALAGLDDAAVDAELSRRRLVRDLARAHRRLRRRRSALRQLERGGGSVPVDAVADEEVLHELRKAAKRVRFAAEAVEPIVGARARRLAKRMRAVQDALGEHRDAVATQAALARLASDADARGESTFGLGRAHAAAEQDALAARARFDRLVRRGRLDPPAWLR